VTAIEWNWLQFADTVAAVANKGRWVCDAQHTARLLADAKTNHKCTDFRPKKKSVSNEVNFVVTRAVTAVLSSGI
jgi:hypothetical protein